MMKIVKREELAAYLPVLKGVCAQENARGDNLKEELLRQDLMLGHQFLIVFAKNEKEPLLSLVCQATVDRVRATHALWVHNFFLVDREKFSATDWSSEAMEFDKFASKFGKVMFMTDNPALLAFLSGLGYYAQATAIVCELTKEKGEALTATQVAGKLGG